MPGVRNPLQMSQIMGQVSRSAERTKDEMRDATRRAQEWAAGKDVEIKYVDLTIHFIGASGLPKMDVVGTADPYFVAKLDDTLKYISTVISNTQSPVWNELWKVKNVPTTADLHVEVLDKDDGTITDDFVGQFRTTVSEGAKELVLEGSSLRRNRGTFWLKIESSASTDLNPSKRPYIFDGPIRFSRHFSPTVGRLTNLDDARLYSTWKMFLRGVRLFFDDTVQPWNRNYKAAQTIFQSPTSLAVRSTIQAGHRMLYARKTSSAFGVINDPQDIMCLLHGGSNGSRSVHAHRVKPAVYTYVISVDDDSFRFSETGAAFFVDFASKHALHANCAEAVRYSGEFHPRPEGGWAAFSDDVLDSDVKWELVIDNNSGTYAPDPMMLPELKALLEYNFPGFTVCAMDFHDPELAESREACRAYALANRGVRREELEPHAQDGEETLSQSALTRATDGGDVMEALQDGYCP